MPVPRPVAAAGSAPVNAAISAAEAVAAVLAGADVARDLVASGVRCLVAGDMGIANTTASAALIAAFTGADPAAATGRGTGIDDETYARKLDVVRRALVLHRPDPSHPLDVLAAMGGLEHAAIAGFVLAAAAERGHTIALQHLGLRPLVDLELRLGEGTGAVLAVPLVQCAVRALRDMATFDSAGVVDKEG